MTTQSTAPEIFELTAQLLKYLTPTEHHQKHPLHIARYVLHQEAPQKAREVWERILEQPAYGENAQTVDAHSLLMTLHDMPPMIDRRETLQEAIQCLLEESPPQAIIKRLARHWWAHDQGADKTPKPQETAGDPTSPDELLLLHRSTALLDHAEQTAVALLKTLEEIDGAHA